MSTRSQIAVADADGTIRAIYCHFDGYLEGVGATLIAQYADTAKVEQLIALGGISSLDEEIGEAHDFDQRPRPPKWTTAYHRDRGETLRIASYADEAEYLASAKDAWSEYLYLFRDGVWLVASTYRSASKFLPVVDEIARENAEADAEDEAA